MAQSVNYQAQQGAFVTGVAEQSPVDWSVLVNAKVVRGIMQPRDGWRVLRRPSHYASVADASSPDGFSWQADAWEKAAYEDNAPLGAFLFSGPAGQDWIGSVWNDGSGTPLFRVTTANGQQVLATYLDTNYVAGTAVSLEPDSIIDTYVFVRAFDTVFFTNGGLLWKWEPLRTHQLLPCEAFHNPQFPNTGIYFEGYIRGARAIAFHQGSLLLGGFGPDAVMACDNPVQVDSSGFPVESDPSKPGGFSLAPDQLGVKVTPYTILVSDPYLPNCFAVLSRSVVNLGSQGQIVAMASHMGRLIVWTPSETWAISGTIADLAGASVQPVSLTIGCAGPRSVAQNDDGILAWATDDGIIAWTGQGAPQKVSAAVQDLFGVGVSGFWRWAFTADSPDPQAVGNMPLGTSLSVRDLCSAVWVAQDEYFAFALTSGNGLENNDLILCWSPGSKQFWVYTHEAATPSWALAAGVWTQGAPSRNSAAVGHRALMVSQNEPGMLFSQAESAVSYQFPAGAFPSGFLAALATITDEKDPDPAIPGEPGTNRFAMIAVSSPIFLGDSPERLNRRLHLRLMGLRIHDFPVKFGEFPDSNPLRLYIIPEQGHEDVLTATQTQSVASEVSPLHPWADAYLTANYFWQSVDWPNAALGRWGGTGVATTDQMRRWLPLAPVDKRVDIPSRVAQWFRVALVKVVDGASDDALRLLSAAVEVVPGYGTRR